MTSPAVIPLVKQLVSQQLNNVPDNMVSTQLTLVLRDFYTKSTAWRQVVGPYNIQAGVALIPLNPLSASANLQLDSGINLLTDLGVQIQLDNSNPTVDNARLQFVLAAWMFPFQQSNSPSVLYPLTRQPIGGIPQPPSRYYMQYPDQMLLYPVPDKTYGPILFVYASLIPLNTGTTLPDMAYTHHLDGLLYGTLARLYRMPKKPWTDKEEGADYEKKYRREILIARDMAERGYGPGESIRFPRFAGRGGSQVLPRATG